jgi:hypothetical protein
LVQLAAVLLSLICDDKPLQPGCDRFDAEASFGLPVFVSFVLDLVDD